MRRIWLGFAWILFGILLGLVGIWDPWIPIINPPRDFWGWASLVWCWCFWTTRTKIDRGDVVYADFSRH